MVKETKVSTEDLALCADIGLASAESVGEITNNTANVAICAIDTTGETVLVLDE